MLTMRYLLKSLKGRAIFGYARAVTEGGGWVSRPKPRPKPRPEKPEFIKEGEFKV